MVWDRETEDSEHRARRLNAKIRFRQRLGHAKISETEWQELDEKIDGQFETELQRTPQEREQEPEEPNQIEIDPETLKEAVQEALAETTDSQQEINDRKLEVLRKIEGQIEKEKTLDAMILENSKLRTQLENHYALAQRQFQEDRLEQRKQYAKELTDFMSKRVYNIILNFADSETEKTLICIYNKQGSLVALSGTLSSKKILTLTDLKIEGVD